MGMASILSAKKIVLLANGAKKHDAVQKLLDDTITTQWPATLLKVHPDVTLICDRAAYEG
jgi:glucosamine-6-phosphate deaminase